MKQSPRALGATSVAMERSLRALGATSVAMERSLRALGATSVAMEQSPRALGATSVTMEQSRRVLRASLDELPCYPFAVAKKAACWVVDGSKISARRIARGMTCAALARRAGVAERTLRRYESGEAKLGKIEHLRYVARVLHVPVESIGAPAEGAPPAVPLPADGAPSPYAAPPERARLFATTQLENIVALEARLPPPKPVDYDGTPIPVLTARKLQNVFSAFAAYEGERFAMIGVVAKQRGASPMEAKMIQSRHGIAVRFLLARDITDGADIKVTVHTAKARETRSLQKAFEEERETCAIVKVVLATEDVVKEEKGFEFFLSPKPLPWGFVVEAVV